MRSFNEKEMLGVADLCAYVAQHGNVREEMRVLAIYLGEKLMGPTPFCVRRCEHGAGRPKPLWQETKTPNPERNEA